MKQVLIYFTVFLLSWQCCWAQSGYNYARPEQIAIGGGSNIPTASTAAARPLVGSFAPGGTASGVFPSAASGYAVGGTATGTGGAIGSNPAYAAFNAQRSTGAASVFNPATTGAAASARPSLQAQQQVQQRTTAGVYGGGGIAPQQYAGSGRIASGSRGTSGNSLDNDYEGGDYSAIPGVPGVDYPLYAEVPVTNFDCATQSLPGYYADVEAQCQVFHICALNRTYSFLCPNGTIFSQETLVCVWWNQYECVTAPSLYAQNAFIYDYGNQGVAVASNVIGGTGGGSGGYQQQLVGGNRAQPSYQNTNTARTAGSSSAAGIFGGGAVSGSGGANLRPTLPSNAVFATATQPSFPSGPSTATRFASNANAAAVAAYPSASTATASAATPYGSTIRNDGYSNSLQEVAYSAAQITPKTAATSNHEYLPPRRP